jgi:cbb3-type cytochrome oxidase subunit 3
MEGEPVMQGDAGRGFVPQRMPAPVVNISDSRSGWLGVAVIGMLVLQAFMMMLVAWRVLLPPAQVAPSAAVAESEAVQELQQRLDALQLDRATEERLAGQRELLDRVLDEVEVTPGGLVTSLEEERLENERLQTRLGAVTAGYEAVEQKKAERDEQVAELNQTIGTLIAEKTEIETFNKEETKRLEAKIAALSVEVDDLKTLADAADTEDQAADTGGGLTWTSILVILVVSVLMLAGITGCVFAWRRGRHTEEAYEAAMPSKDDDENRDDEREKEREPSGNAEE